MSSLALRRLALASTSLAMVVGLPSAANAATCNWLTAAGNWATGGNWSCGTQPGSGDDAIITTGGAFVTLGGINAGAGTINLGAGNLINIDAGSTLAIYNGGLTNNGTITVSNNSDFRNFGATINVTGTGSIILDNSVANARLYSGAWIFGSGQTVRGAGQLGANQTIFTNNGLISANVNGGNLSIDVTGGSGGTGAGNGFGANGNAGLYNTSIMEATGGGALSFESGLYENSGTGAIRAANGSVVSLNNDARILGGTLTSVGTGAINTTGGNEYLNNVTLSAGSNLNVTANNTLNLNTSFVNNGTVTINNTSDLRNEGGTLTITGNGQIVLGNTGSNRIYGGNIVFGSNQNVTGQGQLGINQTTITNNATFSVNTGGTLSIDSTAGSGGTGVGNGLGTNTNSGMLNNGTIVATNGSTIAFESGLYENAGAGIIRADTGSFINLDNDARILNGTLASVGSGVINTTGGTEYLTNVTLASGGNLNVAAGNTLYLNTMFTNDGTLTINNGSDLRNETANLAINGTGAIILGNTGNNRLYGGNITFGAGQTVQGAGQLGANQTTFTINNVFSANAGTVLSIDVTGGSGGTGAGNGVGINANSGLLNNSTIQATGGSSLNFESGLYENSVIGVIQALTGSAINLDNDARILSGTLTSVGTGAINTTGGTEYLNNVTLSSGSKLNVTASNTLYLNTAFTNDGTVTIDNGSDLRNEGGTLTINGNGQIILGAAGTNRIFGGNIIFGSNQNVTGTGQLGVNQTTITNNATFSVNTGGTLSIDVTSGSGGTGFGNGVGTNGNSGLLNNGVIESTGGSTVAFESGLYENAGTGIIRAGTGSFINLDNDARILNGTLASVGSGAINTTGGTEYLTNVTLASGSNLNVATGNTLYLNTAFTNDGTLTINNGSDLRSETADLAINGTGMIVLGGAGNNRLYGGNITIGSGQTVEGNGQFGANQTTIVSNGTISATTGNLSVDVTGGSGTPGGFVNNGLAQAIGGGTLSFESGSYANGTTGLGGELFANSNSTVVFNNDANFANLISGGVLDGGRLYAQGYGGVGTINLRSNQANAISTIGVAGGAATEVILEGAGSVLEVTPFSGGTPVTIDQTLSGVADSGTFALHDRDFAVAANSGNFSNAGLTFVNNTVFTAASFANSGQLIADGTSAVVAPISNSGLVHVASGTLTTQAITGSSGTITIDGGATLQLGGTSTAGNLDNNGNLALGTNNITVTSDYQNANFGSGNAFAAHSNVSGTGLILAASATMDLTGPGLSGNSLNVGNVRLGNSSSTTLTITNNGTLTTLRGAVQSPVTNTVSISSSNFVVGPNGGSTSVTLSYTGNTAGSLSGNTITVANNFDNVADRTLTITGAAYNPAAASLTPNPVNLGATRVGGTLSSVVAITNTAPAGAFSEKLAVTAAAGAGGASGTAPAGLINPGSSANSTVSINTATSGNYSGTVTYALATDGTGTSGLARVALASQSVAVNGKVYQLANAQLSTQTVNFGTVRAGAAAPTANVQVTNTANGALTDSLNTSVASTPAGMTATAPGPLDGGASGNLTFSASTATAGNISGSSTINFTSTDPDLAPVALASQQVDYAGTVTELAIADIFKSAGTGSLSGSGQTYMLDLGSFAAGAGFVTTDLGVLNANLGQSYSETLGGMFASSNEAGYSFAGTPFSGLTGGNTDTGNLLTFNYTGLGAGLYNNTLTFNGYSRYTGLTDFSLSPITVTFKATVTGGTGDPGAVPEPTTWTMLILGFGLMGGMMRRRASLGAVA